MAMPYMTVQVVPERAVFCGSRKKEADDMFKIQLKDLDNDGIKEIGISMTERTGPLVSLPGRIKMHLAGE